MQVAADQGAHSHLLAKSKFVDYRRCSHGLGTGCISTSPGGIMHAKYFLFSATVDPTGAIASNVTWFSSANMTRQSGTDASNNGVSVYNDPDLYEGFRQKIFAPMRAQTSYPDNDFFSPPGRGCFYSTNANTTVYASPQAKGQADFVAQQVTGAFPSKAPHDYGNCVVLLTEHQITSRTDLIAALAGLSKDGCNVQVVVGQKSKEKGGGAHMDCHAYSVLHAAGVPINMTPHIHDKVIQTYSGYSPPEQQFTVFAGSHNLTRSALRANDEVFVKMRYGSTIFGLYLNHFTHLNSSGTPVEPANAGC